MFTFINNLTIYILLEMALGGLKRQVSLAVSLLKLNDSYATAKKLLEILKIGLFSSSNNYFPALCQCW